MNSDDLRNFFSSIVASLRANRWVLPVLALLVAAAIVIPLALAKSGTPEQLSGLPAAPSVTVPAPATTTSAAHHAPSQNYLTGPSHNPFISNTTTTGASATVSGPSTTSASSGASSSTASSSGSATGSSEAQTRSVKTTTSCAAGFKKVTYGGETGCVEHVCRKGQVAADIDGRLACLAPGESGCTVAERPALNSYGYTCVQGVLEVRTKVKITKGPYSASEAEISVLQPAVTGAPTVFHNIARDQLLPDDTAPFGAFLGVRTNGKTAVFVLANNTSVTGAGRCAPSPTICEFLTLEPGQSTKLTVNGAGGSSSSFTLRYVKVERVLSTGSIANVDTTGAAEVKQASSYISQLRNATYAKYTGLLRVDLGATVPVTR